MVFPIWEFLKDEITKVEFLPYIVETTHQYPNTMTIKRIIAVLFLAIPFFANAQCELLIEKFGEEDHYFFTASFPDSNEAQIGNYVWDFGDGTKKIGNYLSHSFNGSGLMHVTVTFISEDSSCQTTAHTELYIKRDKENIVQRFVEKFRRKKSPTLAKSEAKQED